MFLKNFLCRFFTKINLSKVIIIFVVGFTSRLFINYFYGINVFVEFTNIVSLVYYSFMSLFIVFVNEVVIFFEVDFIGAFISLITFCFNSHYFTLGNSSDNSVKYFSSKSINTFARSGAQGDVNDSSRSSGTRRFRRGGPSSAATRGLYPESSG